MKIIPQNITTRGVRPTMKGKRPFSQQVQQFDKYLKENGLSLSFAFEPKYKTKDYTINPYYYVNLLRDGKRVNIKGMDMVLFGYGKDSRKSALKNLMNKVLGYQLKAGRKNIQPFCPFGTEPKTPVKPLSLEIIEL